MAVQLEHDDRAQRLLRLGVRGLRRRGGTHAVGVSITVKNPAPTTSVLIPSSGATLSGSTYLDASASNATSVEFLLFGGTYGYQPQWCARPRRPTTDGCVAGTRRLSPTAPTSWCLRPPGRVGVPSVVRASASPSRTDRQAVALDQQRTSLTQSGHCPLGRGATPLIAYRAVSAASAPIGRFRDRGDR